jgi:hypothetical protein
MGPYRTAPSDDATINTLDSILRLLKPLSREDQMTVVESTITFYSLPYVYDSDSDIDEAEEDEAEEDETP